MPAFSLHLHSPDGAATDCGDIWLQLTRNDNNNVMKKSDVGV